MNAPDKIPPKTGLPILAAFLFGVLAAILLVWFMRWREAGAPGNAVKLPVTAPVTTNAVTVELSRHLNGALNQR